MSAIKFNATLLDLAHNQKAEQALEDAAFIFNSVGQEDMKGDAAKSLMQFYASVRCLVRELECRIKIRENHDRNTNRVG